MSTAPALLIVADACDAATAEVARLVTASIGGRTRLVSSAELSMATWSHRVDTAGRASTGVRLRDGTEFGADLRVAYLATTLPMPRLLGATATDRAYAASEFTALLTSWLHGLGDRALNAPSGIQPNGPGWSPGMWLAEAAAARLPVRRSTRATSARLLSGWHGPAGTHRQPVVGRPPVGADVLIAGTDCAGPLPDELRSACAELGKRSGCRVFALRLAAEPTGPCVAAVTPAPALASAEHVSVLARFLTEWSDAP